MDQIVLTLFLAISHFEKQDVEKMYKSKANWTIEHFYSGVIVELWKPS